MSIPFDSTTLLYAVVEHLPSEKHLTDPVDTPPELPGQYRFVCLALNVVEAERIAHLLRALAFGTYEYTINLATPASIDEQSWLALTPD
jgi:hypothetical protein